MDAISIWDELSYLDGMLFTIWLGIMYFGKCYIDDYFKDRPKKDKKQLLND